MVLRKQIAKKEEFYIRHLETFCNKRSKTYYISSCFKSDPLRLTQISKSFEFEKVELVIRLVNLGEEKH